MKSESPLAVSADASVCCYVIIVEKYFAPSHPDSRSFGQADCHFALFVSTFGPLELALVLAKLDILCALESAVETSLLFERICVKDSSSNANSLPLLELYSRNLWITAS